jgi:hypothetical protein
MEVEVCLGDWEALEIEPLRVVSEDGVPRVLRLVWGEVKELVD